MILCSYPCLIKNILIFQEKGLNLSQFGFLSIEELTIVETNSYLPNPSNPGLIVLYKHSKSSLILVSA